MVVGYENVENVPSLSRSPSHANVNLLGCVLVVPARDLSIFFGCVVFNTLFFESWIFDTLQI